MPAEVRRLPRGRTRRRHPAAPAAALAAGLLLVGCTSGAEPPAAQPRPSSRASSAAQRDLSGLPVAREFFCDRVDELDVETALGGPVTGTAHYGNGDRVEISPGYTDISHEYGCTYRGMDPAYARAWVYARPVPPKEARGLARAARREPGCRFPSSVGFGRPDLTSVCRVRPATEEDLPAVRVRMQGLFGGSWLTCELTLPAEGPTGGRDRALDEARNWCADLVSTVGARR